jgi:hypothetical protein
LCHFCISADQCTSLPVETHACGRHKIHDDEEEHFQLESAATTFCNKLLQNPSFAACRAVSIYAGTWFVIQTYLDGLKQNFLCPVYIFFSKLSLKMQQRSVLVWHTIFFNSFSHHHGFPGLVVFFQSKGCILNSQWYTVTQNWQKVDITIFVLQTTDLFICWDNYIFEYVMKFAVV